MTDKLKLYNKALRHIGNPRLADLNENRKDRRELDEVYDDALLELLERGIWYYALRTVEMTPDTGLEPSFGLPYAYPEPDDFVRLASFCVDPDQNVEDLERRHEKRIFYSRNTTIYMSYVSKDAAYGLDIGNMKEVVAEALGCDLALKTSLPINGDRGDRDALMSYASLALHRAKAVEAMDERPRFRPVGSLVRARSSGGSRVLIRNGNLRRL